MPQWQVLVRELLPKLDDTLKHELVHWAAFYEHRVQVGSKEIFHLEVRACGTVVAVCFCLSVLSVCGVRVVCVFWSVSSSGVVPRLPPPHPPIFYVYQAFCARFMQLYKDFVINLFG